MKVYFERQYFGFSKHIKFLYKVSVLDHNHQYQSEFYLVADQKGNQWHRTSLVDNTMFHDAGSRLF